MNKQMVERLARLEAASQMEKVTITRIVIEAAGHPAGVEMIRQPDGSWKHETYPCD